MRACSSRASQQTCTLQRPSSKLACMIKECRHGDLLGWNPGRFSFNSQRHCQCSSSLLQQQDVIDGCLLQQHSIKARMQRHRATSSRCEQHRRRTRCCSSTGDGQAAQPQAGEQQQATPQQKQQQQDHGSLTSRPGSPKQYASVIMPTLEQQQPRVSPLLSWLPPPLRLHLQSLLGFLRACWELLPEFISPSLPEAMRRLALVLGASLVMIVVVSTIDSGWLYLYLLNARQVPMAA